MKIILKNWIIAVRPKTLFASLSPVLLGLSLAFHNQHKLNLLVAFLTLACTICLQIASNLANDYLDFLRGIDNVERTGPVRATQAKLIPARQMKMALILTLTAAFLMGIYLMIVGGLPIIIIGLLSLYFAYGYTGGPFPLSYNALGELAAFIFFGPIAVLGSFYLQTHFTNIHGFLLGIGAGSIAATILAINNLRDMKSDSLTKKKTIALLFGEIFQRRLCLVLITVSVLVICLHSLILGNLLAMASLLVPLLFYSNWKYIFNGKINETLNLTLAKTAQYLFLYSLAIGTTLVIS
jgi:1,4-dihydroxy-2-naphthoate octaprenyltransferase